MYVSFAILFTVAVLAVTVNLTTASHQTYPGTESRPILSEDEASLFIQENYFTDWIPEEIENPDEPDYVVKSGESVQEAVNKAIRAGGTERKFVRIDPGIYTETVYIQGDVPITIYGGGSSPDDVVIIQNISAKAPVSDYKNLVNPDDKRYQKGDPAWSLYNDCSQRSDTVGTNCSAVFWVTSNRFQLANVTVKNSGTDGQAVALKIDADQVHLMDSKFLGAQDTVYLGATSDDERIYLHMCHIEGDVDFIFGKASAILDMCTLKAVDVRNKESAIIFAPNTNPSKSYGFLVLDSTITGDQTFLGSDKVSLARAWDTGVESPEDYVPGRSPNGQLVIRDTQIDDIINVDAPYASSATSARPFSGDIELDRNLDDNTYNRIWEFNNSGKGA